MGHSIRRRHALGVVARQEMEVCMEAIVVGALIGALIGFVAGMLVATFSRDGIWPQAWALLILFGAATGMAIGIIGWAI